MSESNDKPSVISTKKLPVIPKIEDKLTLSKIKGEQLLKSVLPEELYLQLCATGRFECEIDGLKFKFSREAKTTVKKGPVLYSCCIDLEVRQDSLLFDDGPPDQDRLVAEYLLALNNVNKYMSTANLTEIARDRQDAMTGAALNALWRDEIMRWTTSEFNARLADYYDPVTIDNEADAARYSTQAGRTLRVGDTINIRRPRRFEPRPNIRPYTQPAYRAGRMQESNVQRITQVALMLLCRIEPFNRPYASMTMAEAVSIHNLDAISYYVDFSYRPDLLLHHLHDELLIRALQPHIEELCGFFRDRRVVSFGILDIPPTFTGQGGDGVIRVNGEDGRSIRFLSNYQIMNDYHRGRFDILVYCERLNPRLNNQPLDPNRLP